MRLTDEEYREIAIIVDQYRETSDSLDRMQEKLERVLVEKNMIESRIELIRDRENKLFADLEKQYGKGRLDLLTMEYISDGDT